MLLSNIVDENLWVVYMHTVPKEISGHDVDKRYIGITRQNPLRRWENGCGYKKQFFYHAIKKYGWDNIKHEIITSTSDYNHALELEEFYISILKTNNREYGYNCYGKRNLEKTKNKEFIPSDISLGKHPNAKSVICLTTLEIFDCIVSASKKYNINPSHIISCCNGKIKSIGRHPDTKEPLMWEYYDDTKNYVVKKYEQNNRGRKVVCLTTNELFSRVKIAEKYYNLTHRSIDRNCNGVKNLRGGAGILDDGRLLQWQYYADYLKENNLTDEEAQKSLFFIE